MPIPKPYKKPQGSLSYGYRIEIDGENKDETGGDEILRLEPYFNDNFQKSLRDGLDLANAIVQCLKKTKVQKFDSGLHTILETAQDTSRFDTRVTRTVGVAGDSAAGKGSLINSLLDQDLAHTGDQRSAATSFVTEYKLKPDDDDSNFLVEAEYLALEELDEHLEELLWSFRQPYAPDLKTDVGGEELKNLETASQVAGDTLKAAFGNQSDFHEELLKDFSDGSFKTILSTLRTWARSMEWPSGAEEGIWKTSASTAEQCWALTKQFMKDGFIYLHAPVLETGLILADLPGYRDINFARVKAAQGYQANCDEVFIVANINRAVTDQSIKAIIGDYLGSGAKIAGPITHPNVTIVCTHAAGINLKKAEESYGTAIGKKVIERLRRVMNEARNREYKDHEKAKTNFKYRFITARNNHITSQLQKAYAKEFASNELPVFCVHNNDYQDPYFALNRELTGVPHLRGFCLSVSAKTMFRQAHNFLGHLLPALVQKLKLWCAANLSKVSSFPDFGIIIAVAFVRERVPAIQFGALSASRKWESWHEIVLWKQRHIFHQNSAEWVWNSDLLQVMNTELQSSWKQLDELLGDNLIALGTMLHNAIDEAIDASEEDRMPPAFIRILVLRQREVQHMIDDETESFLRNFRMIKRDATGPDHNSYIMAQMRPVYRRCGQDNGSGTFARCKVWIHSKIFSETIFPSIRKATRAVLQTTVAETEERLKTSLEFVCDGIENDIETIRNSSDSVSGEKRKLKTVLKELLSEADEVLEDIAELGAEATNEARERGYIRDEEL